MSGETVFCPGVVVADSDLVAGLLAVAPHAGKPDQGRGAHRVRLYADPASGWLAIAADGRGTALARVPAVASGEYWSTPGEPWDGDVGDVIDVDVSAPVAALVAKAFRRREGVGHRLEVLVDEHRRFLSVTDVEGLAADGVGARRPDDAGDRGRDPADDRRAAPIARLRRRPDR